MFHLFRVLARSKGLRGMPIDPFGWSEERRRERQLIATYERWIDIVVATLDPATHAAATRLATLPEDIRGYGRLKLRSMDVAEKSAIELLAILESAQS